MFFHGKADSGAHLVAQQMAVTEIGVYRGPHHFSHIPMIGSSSISVPLKTGRPIASPASPMRF